MFVNDKNYFLAYKNVDVLIRKCNQELKRSNEWPGFNELSLNTRTKKFYTFP